MAIHKTVGGLDCSLSNFGMSKGLVITDDDGSNPRLSISSIQLVQTSHDKSIQYKNQADLARAKTLGEAMLKFFADCDVIYVELPIGSQSARAMASYGICIGVIAALGKRVVRVSPKAVKEAATGDSGASKQDMIQWATKKYPTLPWATKKVKNQISYTGKNEHVADSIAAIHAGVFNKEK